MPDIPYNAEEEDFQTQLVPHTLIKKYDFQSFKTTIFPSFPHLFLVHGSCSKWWLLPQFNWSSFGNWRVLPSFCPSELATDGWDGIVSVVVHDVAGCPSAVSALMRNNDNYRHYSLLVSYQLGHLLTHIAVSIFILSKMVTLTEHSSTFSTTGQTLQTTVCM